MKKITFAALALVFALLGGCGDAEDGKIENMPSQNSGKTESSNEMSNNSGKMLKYDENGLSFDIPDVWQNNFKSVSNEVGSGESKYMKTDFLYTEGDRDIMVMSVGRFTKQQWENLKKNNPDAETMKLGETKDYIYSIVYEDHDYIEGGELREILKDVREKATSLRSTIKIK